MNRSVTTAFLFAALVASTLTIAQGPAPNAGSGKAETAPTAETGKTPPQTSREATGDSDARRCLEFPTSPQVIRCAERFLPRRSKG